MTARETSTARVRRVLPATPDVVFGEWLDPDALAEFICPFPARAVIISCDPRIGGRYAIEMIGLTRTTRVTGEYLELERPHRLRFTWRAELDGGFDSIVTVTLEPHDETRTIMTIEHVRLPTEWSGAYQHGWELVSEQLSQKLASTVKRTRQE